MAKQHFSMSSVTVISNGFPTFSSSRIGSLGVREGWFSQPVQPKVPIPVYSKITKNKMAGTSTPISQFSALH